MANQKRIVGDILAIDLQDGTYGFAKVLQNPLFGFYNLRSSTLPDAIEIIKHPLLFKIWVMKYAVNSGRWKRIGKSNLTKSELENPAFFKQDTLDPSKLFIYSDGKDIPANMEDIVSLECAAVWDPEHVEDRLRDYFNGRKNKWVESLKPKLE
jgi:hypothetical protein